MGYTINEIKKNLQSFFSEGSLTIIGSGLSIAEGIPGMGPLATEIMTEIPKVLNLTHNDIWNQIVYSLENKRGLEETLLQFKPDGELEEQILLVTSRFIRKNEKNVLNDIFFREKKLRFSKFVKKLPIPNVGLPIITTNYDRLIEISCEMEDIPVDNMFHGINIGKLDTASNRFKFCSNIVKSRTSFRLEYHKRIKIYKPHGCLSWYHFQGRPISSSLDLESKNLIITPGLNKFRAGYEQPFDIHREKANKEIDAANRFIIIGYGFNDDHLETHLMEQIKKGLPTLIITRSLSDNAKDIIKKCPNVASLSFAEKNNNNGTLYHYNGTQTFLINEHWWDLGIFTEEVL